MKIQNFGVLFYLEGNDEIGFYARQSTASPKKEYGWGETVSEAVSNLCRLLSGEFTEPVIKSKGLNSDDELRAWASEVLGCTCDSCLNIARKQKEIENEKRMLPEELLKKINRHDPDFIPGLVESSIGIYLEYIHAHGKTEDEAKAMAVIEMLDSLDYDGAEACDTEDMTPSAPEKAKYYLCPRCEKVWDSSELLYSEGKCLDLGNGCNWEDDLEEVTLQSKGKGEYKQCQ